MFDAYQQRNFKAAEIAGNRGTLLDLQGFQRVKCG